MPIIEIRNKTDTSAEIEIYGDITDEQFFDTDVTPKFIKELLKDLENKELEVHINSGGGGVFAGFAIANMLKNHKKKTRAYIDGLAGSIASVIALSCDEIVVYRNSYLMVHNPYTGCFGDAQKLRQTADILEKLKDSIVETYISKAKEQITKEQIIEYMNLETWFNGEEMGEIFSTITVNDSFAAVACTSEIKYKDVPQEIKFIKKAEPSTKTINNCQLEIQSDIDYIEMFLNTL